jgi:translation initiation factor IF-2
MKDSFRKARAQQLRESYRTAAQKVQPPDAIAPKLARLREALPEGALVDGGQSMRLPFTRCARVSGGPAAARRGRLRRPVLGAPRSWRRAALPPSTPQPAEASPTPPRPPPPLQRRPQDGAAQRGALRRAQRGAPGGGRVLWRYGGGTTEARAPAHFLCASASTSACPNQLAPTRHPRTHPSRPTPPHPHPAVQGRPHQAAERVAGAARQHARPGRPRLAPRLRRRRLQGAAGRRREDGPRAVCRGRHRQAGGAVRAVRGPQRRRPRGGGAPGGGGAPSSSRRRRRRGPLDPLRPRRGAARRGAARRGARHRAAAAASASSPRSTRGEAAAGRSRAAGRRRGHAGAARAS